MTEQESDDITVDNINRDRVKRIWGIIDGRETLTPLQVGRIMFAGKDKKKTDLALELLEQKVLTGWKLGGQYHITVQSVLNALGISGASLTPTPSNPGKTITGAVRKDGQEPKHVAAFSVLEKMEIVSQVRQHMLWLELRLGEDPTLE